MTETFTEFDVAWAAGFFDGEGSVSIRRTWSKASQRKLYGLYLSVAQVERAPLEKLRALFGTGWINRSPAKGSGTKGAPYYTWVVTGSVGAGILQRLLPYLTVKKERAIIAIEFQTHTGYRRSSSKRLTDEEMALRHGYYVRMRYLNLRYAARLAAETERESAQPSDAVRCDSPVCRDEKPAEGDRNDRPRLLHRAG